MSDGVPTKACKGCGQEKPLDLDHFYFNQRDQSWFPRCKPCFNSQSEAARRLRREEMDFDIAAWAHHLLNTAEKNARKHGRPLEIDEAYVVNLWEQQDGLCAHTGWPMSPVYEHRGPNCPSLDRVDSKQGYVPGNVVLCLSWINRMKNDTPMPEWVLACAAVCQKNGMKVTDAASV